MNVTKPASSALVARHLVHTIRTCKTISETIATNDHATMDEIERALASAEAAAQRLLQDMQRQAGANDEVVDLDDF